MARYSHWLLPLTILAFIGPSVSFLSEIFTPMERWIFLALLAVQQLVDRRRAMTGNAFVFLLFIYAIWCITTTFWSEVFSLSLYKSLVFFATAFTMLYAGHGWVTRQGAGKSFDYLLPITVVAYAAAILGYFLSPSPYYCNYYQGFAHGSNMLGSLMGMTAPLVIWQLHRDWGSVRRRNAWMVILGLCFVFILMSHSRASLLVVLFILGGYLLSMTRKRMVILGYLAVLLVALAWSLLPEVSSGLVHQLLYKDSESIFFSRIKPWEESMDKAELGGWLGGGYGVSIGSVVWEGEALSSVGYGREKGNAQMAIVEETGVVGLALYAAMVIALFNRLLAGYRSVGDKDVRTALAIFMGALVGMLVQSAFEAWWASPGSPESPVFWTLAGAALGLADLGRRQALGAIRG